MNSLIFLRSKSFISFVLFGFLITLLSNSLLILILFILPLGLATFISQTIHAYLGYVANKYKVFKRKGDPISYILLVIFSWIIQWVLIKTITSLGFTSNISVLIAIPFMVTFSFLSQKFIIFK